VHCNCAHETCPAPAGYATFLVVMLDRSFVTPGASYQKMHPIFDNGCQQVITDW